MSPPFSPAISEGHHRKLSIKLRAFQTCGHRKLELPCETSSWVRKFDATSGLGPTGRPLRQDMQTVRQRLQDPKIHE
eukprot:758018-Hanusia_phi.AAC.4